MSELLNKYPYISLLLVILSILLLLALIIQKISFAKKIKLIRQDAIKRSKAVIGGLTVEQLAPYLPDFPCNPGDVRFVGKPVDFVAFSGLTEKGRIDEIVLIEVKTGESALNEREKEVRKAVQEGRVRYEQWWRGSYPCARASPLR